MSVIAFTTNVETAGKILYIKESVLLAKNLPTKIIFRFVANFTKKDYKKLLAEESPNLTILTPMKVQENTIGLLTHRLVQAELTKRASLPHEYKYRIHEDQKIAKRYLDEIKKFTPTENLSDDWVGLYWQPRSDIEPLEFYAPLKAKLTPSSKTRESTKLWEIRIKLPEQMPPLFGENVNIGLMVELKTKDIPFVSHMIMRANIELYNWTKIGKKSFERSHLLTPVAGELWIQYPTGVLFMGAFPEADGIVIDTEEDERVAREISHELYNVDRLTEYMPEASKISLRWDLDRHITNWLDNKTSFVSTAFLPEEFQEYLRSLCLSYLKPISVDVEKRIRDYVSQMLGNYEIPPSSLEYSQEISFQKGTPYLFENQKDRVYDLFIAAIQQEGLQGLCIVRGTLKPEVENLGEKVEVVSLVADSTVYGGLNSAEEIVKKVRSFCLEKENPIVLFDGLGFIVIFQKDFVEIQKFLEDLIDPIVENGAVLLVPVNPLIFEIDEYRKISNKFTIIKKKLICNSEAG